MIWRFQNPATNRVKPPSVGPGRSNVFLGLFETPRSSVDPSCDRPPHRARVAHPWFEVCPVCHVASPPLKRRPGRWQKLSGHAPPVRSSTETCLRPRKKIYDMNHEIHVYFFWIRIMDPKHAMVVMEIIPKFKCLVFHPLNSTQPIRVLIDHWKTMVNPMWSTVLGASWESLATQVSYYLRTTPQLH